METPIKRTLFKDMIASKFNKAFEQSPGMNVQSKKFEQQSPSNLEAEDANGDELNTSLPVVQASPGRAARSSPAKGTLTLLTLLI